MIRIPLICACLLIAYWPTPGHALSCSVTADDVAFGGVSPLDGLTTDALASITIECSELIAATPEPTVTICVDIDAGSGGSDNVGNRFLQGSSTSIAYNLYKDAGRSQVWGSDSAFPASGGVRAAVALTGILGLLNEGSTTLTLYARLPGDFQSAEAGVYSSNFSGQVRVRYSFDDALPCDGASGDLVSTSMQASANVLAQCLVSVGSLDFGAHADLTTDVDGSTNAAVSCTNGQPYTLAFGVGTAPLATVDSRAMQSGTSLSTIGYQLYRDAARTEVWGSGAASLAGTGNGDAQNATVYGRIPAQALPPPGSYSDAVIATVSF